ncbi:hypothetical protein HPP92_012369 [Vanilla planifolia]|uniref:Uncharacterized protein n=1 Tax=Vanilla planifolia TaxID=51239 RepID=A0A835QQC4_VANPL|nr:hypothetical protein HPP92_012369 [Vanilla planifolia]
MRGPCNITPLHVAAVSSNADTLLDILTDDPGQLGVKAWRNSRDSTGFTPEDYARARGHESYIFMMQKKINRSTETCDVVVNFPTKSSFVSDSNHKQSEESKHGKQSGLEVEKIKAKVSQPPICKLCEQHLACRRVYNQNLKRFIEMLQATKAVSLESNEGKAKLNESFPGGEELQHGE